MNEIFGVLDDRFRVSIVDSTMMWIVHHAMDKAHERVKSREGVIERLHEISKFYELSVMQLDGCLRFVQEADNNLESSHEEVLLGLTEIRNRLQRRLHESELAICQKDRELTDRFESELKLTKALEIKERELHSQFVSSQSSQNLEIAKTMTVDNENKRFECDDYEPNQCIKDEKVEEMGSDIDILKETLDIAFGKMHSAIFLSEMGQMEQQIRSNIENGIISIFVHGFVRDTQDDFAVEARTKEDNNKHISNALIEHWSDLMNEAKSLCEDLKHVITQNEVPLPLPLPKSVDQSEFGCNSHEAEEKHCHEDTTNAKYGISNSENKPDQVDESHYVAKMIKNHESIIRKKSAEAEELNRLRQEMLREKATMSLKKGKNPLSLKSRAREILEKLENLIALNAKVNETFGENKHNYEVDDDDDDASLEKRVQASTKIDGHESHVDTLDDVWDKMHRVDDEENTEKQNEISTHGCECDEREFQRILQDEIHITLLKGSMEEFLNDFIRRELENLIKDEITRDLIRNMSNHHQQNETIESNEVKSELTNDENHVVINETMKDENVCSEGSTSSNDISQSLECKVRQEAYGIPFVATLKTWQENIGEYKTEIHFREEMSKFVLVETIKSVNYYKPNHCQETRFSNDFLQHTTLKEDVCLVFLREMVKEWKEKIEAEEIENLILSASTSEIMNCNNSHHRPVAGDESKPPFDIKCTRSSLSGKPEISTSLEGKLTDFHNGQLNQSSSDSLFIEVVKFSHFFDDFKLMASKKLGGLMLRLEEIEHTLNPVVRVVTSLRENESLYKKAFVRRCQNLKMAENEVDLLGDQVDILYCLLEKIYSILNYHSPVLQQHFNVSEILGLIKEEVDGNLLNTTND